MRIWKLLGYHSVNLLDGHNALCQGHGKSYLKCTTGVDGSSSPCARFQIRWVQILDGSLSMIYI